jgi:hypothetical protein
MTYLMTTNSPGDAKTFLKVTERVERHAQGLLALYAGINERGLAITSVWESKAHSDRFTVEHLIPAIRELVGEGAGVGITVDFECFHEHTGAQLT